MYFETRGLGLKYNQINFEAAAGKVGGEDFLDFYACCSPRRKELVTRVEIFSYLVTSKIACTALADFYARNDKCTIIFCVKCLSQVFSIPWRHEAYLVFLDMAGWYAWSRRTMPELLSPRGVEMVERVVRWLDKESQNTVGHLPPNLRVKPQRKYKRRKFDHYGGYREGEWFNVHKDVLYAQYRKWCDEGI